MSRALHLYPNRHRLASVMSHKSDIHGFADAEHLSTWEAFWEAGALRPSVDAQAPEAVWMLARALERLPREEADAMVQRPGTALRWLRATQLAGEWGLTLDEVRSATAQLPSYVQGLAARFVGLWEAVEASCEAQGLTSPANRVFQWEADLSQRSLPFDRLVVEDLMDAQPGTCRLLAALSVWAERRGVEVDLRLLECGVLPFDEALAPVRSLFERQGESAWLSSLCASTERGALDEGRARRKAVVPTMGAAARAALAAVREAIGQGKSLAEGALVVPSREGWIEVLEPSFLASGLALVSPRTVSFAETRFGRMALELPLARRDAFPVDRAAVVLEWAGWEAVLPWMDSAGLRDDAWGQPAGRGAYGDRLERCAEQAEGQGRMDTARQLRQAADCLMKWTQAGRRLPERAPFSEWAERWLEAVDSLAKLPRQASSFLPLEGSLLAWRGLAEEARALETWKNWKAVFRQQTSSLQMAVEATAFSAWLQEGLNRLQWTWPARAEEGLRLLTPEQVAGENLQWVVSVGHEAGSWAAPLGADGMDELLDHCFRVLRPSLPVPKAQRPSKLEAGLRVGWVAACAEHWTAIAHQASAEGWPVTPDPALEQFEFEAWQAPAELLALPQDEDQALARRWPEGMRERQGSQRWRDVDRVATAERERSAFFFKGELSPGPYSGRVSATSGADWLLGDADKPFSASDFDRLGNCAFAAWMDMGLGLAGERARGWELAPDQKGTLLHAALEWLLGEERRAQTLRHLAQSDSSALRAWAEAAAEAAVEKRKKWSAQVHPALWPLEKERLVQSCLALLASPEHLFPFPGAEVLAVEAVFGRQTPMFLPLGEGQQIAVEGRIDRVDRSPQGLGVVDYKSGSLPSKPALGEALSRHRLQLPVYAWVAQLLWGGESVDAAWVTPKGNAQAVTLSEALSAAGGGSVQSFLDGLPSLLKQRLQQLRGGDWSPRAFDCTHCAYSGHCRIEARPDLDAGGDS